MEIRVLKNFMAVAEEGNITAAANSLHISQSALSRQMLDLEQELNTQLFVRTNRSSQLTSEGLIFRERARKILELSDMTLDEFRKKGTRLKGQISFITCFGTAEKLAGELISGFHAIHPDVLFELKTADPETAMNEVMQDHADFALVAEPCNTEQFHITETGLEQELGVLMRPDDPFAAYEALKEEQLKEMKLIVFHRYINPRYPKKLKISRRELKISGTYTLISAAAPLVRASYANALCLEPEPSLCHENDLVFRPLAPKVTYRSVFIYRRHHILTNQASAFLEYALEKLKQKQTAAAM